MQNRPFAKNAIILPEVFAWRCENSTADQVFLATFNFVLIRIRELTQNQTISKLVLVSLKYRHKPGLKIHYQKLKIDDLTHRS